MPVTDAPQTQKLRKVCRKAGRITPATGTKPPESHEGILEGPAIMRRLFILVVTCSLAGLAAAPPNSTETRGSNASSQERTPTLDEVRAITDRAIAAQHMDDAAINSYERIERHVVRTSATANRVTEDKTYRVVPAGSGTLKLLIKDGGKPVSQDEYLRQLRAWEQILEITANLKDPRAKADQEKWQKRTKDREDLVDAARQAYLATWRGRETHDGRVYAKLLLEPKREFQPHSRSAEMLTHARATIWIDEASGQLERGNVEIIKDISFGGGILGKIYRGGRLDMQQAEIAPGVWFPTRYQYDFVGRKFLFGFEVHEYTEIGHYRWLGTPQEALALVRRELQDGQGIPGDP